MKLSLNWLLEHLDHQISKNFASLLDFAQDFAQKFNRSIGEMEKFTNLKLNNDLYHGKYLKSENELAEFEIDGQAVKIKTDINRNAWLVNDQSWRLANYRDIFSDKDGVLPEPNQSDHNFYKSNFEDIIFEIENKSLTHRADLWSHYGMAREISALYDWKLKDLKLDQIKIIDYNLNPSEKTGQIKVKLSEIIKNACPKFAVCQIDNIKIIPSPIDMVIKLASVGSRSINLPVDLTNYVMLDIGNPMHAFDKKSFTTTHLIEPKFAENGQKLKLLDEKTITLNDQDLIISDSNDPLALAGIMGGHSSGVNNKTTSIILEAAVFDPGVIRKATVRHKTRTEASTRFEKGLDLSGNLTAIEAYVTNLKKYLPEIQVFNIISIGNLPDKQKIRIKLNDFKKKLSIEINNDKIIEILKKFKFEVTDKNEELEIKVPLARGTREFVYEADILEEIGRFVGFDNVKSSIPKISLKGWDIQKHLRSRHIKDFCAYNGGMNEVSNYPLFDELWLTELRYQLESNLRIINPVSEFRFRPVNNLIIHLAQNIYNNRLEKSLKLFEVAPVWQIADNKPQETKKLAVAWLGTEDFYDFRNFWFGLFNSLGIDVDWEASEHSLFKNGVTAKLILNNQTLGFVGYAAPFIETRIGRPLLIAEVDTDILVCNYAHSKLKPLNKYPISKLDVSFFIADQTVSKLEKLILTANNMINHVELIDTMKKPEWKEKNSYTFRYNVTCQDRNLNKDDLQKIIDDVQMKLKEIGAEIR
jgi:phenylalanyl-tRNA synthetase beta chain